MTLRLSTIFLYVCLVLELCLAKRPVMSPSVLKCTCMPMTAVLTDHVRWLMAESATEMLTCFVRMSGQQTGLIVKAGGIIFSQFQSLLAHIQRQSRITAAYI